MSPLNNHEESIQINGNGHAEVKSDSQIKRITSVNSLRSASVTSPVHGLLDDDKDTDQRSVHSPLFSRILLGDASLKNPLVRTSSTMSNRAEKLLKGFGIFSRPEKKRHTILVTPERKIQKLKSSQAKKKIRKVHFRLPKSKNDRKLHILEPGSAFLEKWLRFMMLPLSYELWAFPFRLAFCDPRSIPILMSDLACDIIFFCDVLVRLNTAIPAETYPGQTEAITDWSGVAEMYARHSLLPDFLPVLVYWATTLSLQTSPDRLLWIWWVTMIPRLFTRVSRLASFFRSMETNLELNVRNLQAIKICLVIVLSSHWVGCIYYFLARVQSFSENTWVRDFEHLLPLYSFSHSTVATNYLLCIYKGFNALSNLAYDLGLPSNMVEMLYSLFVMTVQIYLSALILGTLLNYLVRKNPTEEAHKQHMEQVKQFMEGKSLPVSLQERVLAYFEFQYRKNVNSSLSTSMDLPRSLRIKVANANYHDLIMKCASRGKPFVGCSSQFYNALMTRLQVMHVMSSEEIVKRDEIPRELYFVSEGAALIIDEKDRTIGVIRSDVPDIAPIIGEVPFFLGINYVHTIKAKADEDLELLVLSKEDSSELFSSYPEEHQIICENLLRKFDLDANGDSIKGAQEDPSDVAKLATKTKIIQSIKNRAERLFFSLSHAANAGDVETVLQLIRQGADINKSNYDKRTVLHMACAEGNYRMVEILLNSGAEKDIKDRWGQTPLQTAINHKQLMIVGLLTQWKASLGFENAASALCESSGGGDLAQVRRLIENGVSPNLGDYDRRTALHVASAEGHDKVVEYLLSKKADPNAADRWGGTPLQDALLNGHALVATLLKAKGGSMPQDVGSEEVCSAAGLGDVKRLRLMHDYGQPTDVGDYDFRYPLHLAAAEAKVLAVSFLLGVSADPNCTDRWGGTPMDDTLRGGTLYHMFCAKLIQGWGGELGIYKDKEEGKRFTERLNSISIRQVRLLIKSLIEQGLDKKSPKHLSLEELNVLIKASGEMMPTVLQLSSNINSVTGDIQEFRDLLHAQVLFLKTKIQMIAESAPLARSSTPVAVKLMWMDKIQATIESMQLIGGQELESMVIDELDLDGDIDSETEYALYEELDELLEAQERAEAQGVHWEKLAVSSFRQAAMRLTDIEMAYEQLCKVACSAKSDVVSFFSSNPFLSSGDLSMALSILRAETGNIDVDDIFFEVQQHLELIGKRMFSDGESSIQEDELTGAYLSEIFAGSPKFRKCLLGMEVDLMLCALMRSDLKLHFSELQVQELLQEHVKVTAKAGDKIFDSSKPDGSSWYFVLSGDVRCALEEGGAVEAGFGGIGGAGSFFGGMYFLSGLQPVQSIVAHSQSKILKLSRKKLEDLIRGRKEESLRALARQMLEATDVKSLEEGEERKGSTVADTFQNSFQNMFRSFSFRSFRTPNGSGLSNARVVPFPLHEAGGGGRGVGDKLMSALEEEEEEEEEDLVDITVTEEDRRKLKESFTLVSECWKTLSLGSSSVAHGQVRSIKTLVGESGAELFEGLFADVLQNDAIDITVNRFWGCWIEFLLAGVTETDDSWRSRAQKANFKQEEEEAKAQMETLESEEDEQEGIVEAMHARFAPVRSLRRRFAEYEISMWEREYGRIAGGLNESLSSDRVELLLRNVFYDHPYRITKKNCRELFEFVGKRYSGDTRILWSDLQKALRDQQAGIGLEETGLFVGRALNPNSVLYDYWRLLLKLVAVYDFVTVPIRIAFKPWNSMLSPVALGTDLTADSILVLHLLLELNTAFKNERSLWVTHRYKIFRHADLAAIISALPLDWFAYVCGASLEACDWLRLNKLFLLRGRIWEARAGLSVTLSSTSSMILRMATLMAMTLHIGACIWFFIGRSYAEWFPSRAISWFYVRPVYSNITFDHRKNFAMVSSRTGEEYLLSLYWVAATLTVNGAVGDLIPQNLIEIVFTIVLMALNMTLYRWVIGEVSTIIMSADDDVVQRREQMEKIKIFISGGKFSNKLQEEIKSHFWAVQNGSTLDQTVIFKGLNHGLQVEVARFISRKHLDNVELFKGCSEFLLDGVCVLLREVSFMPEEVLFHVLEVSKAMFFVMSGAVEEVQEKEEGETVTAVRRTNHSVGGLSFFFGLRQLETARASKGGAVCLRLERESFFELLKTHQKDEDIIAQNAMRTFEVVNKSRMGGSSKHSGYSGMSSQSSGSLRKKRRRESLEEDTASKKSGGSTSKKSSNSKHSEEKSTTVSSNLEGNDSDDSSELVAGEGTNDKISMLKTRRKNERITLLLTLAAHGDVDKVRRLLANAEASVNDEDSLKRTALHVAASEGHGELVKTLLKMKADANLKDNFDNTPLNDAVRMKHDKVATLIRDAVAGVRVILPGNQAGVLMCQAAADGDKEQIKRLLDNGVGIDETDYDGRTALHLACCEGHVDLVQFLLTSKANIASQDRFKGTPLEDAVRHTFEVRSAGHVQSILRDFGASLSLKKSDYAAKTCALAARGDLRMMQVLVDNGVEVDISDYDGRTPLHLAAANGNTSILEYLIKQEGVVVNAVDRFGFTPLDDALRHSKKTAVAILEEVGGKTHQDPELAAIREEHAVRMKRRKREEMLPRVAEIVSNSPESHALQWTEKELLPRVRGELRAMEETLSEIEKVWKEAEIKISSHIQDYFQVSSELAVVLGPLAKDSRKKMIALRRLLESEYSESGPIACKLWSSLSSKFRNVIADIMLDFRNYLHLLRIAKDLLKEIGKQQKRLKFVTEQTSRRASLIAAMEEGQD